MWAGGMRSMCRLRDGPRAMIEVFSHSEPGGHTHNEDALVVRALPPGLEGYVCVVADGQGGQRGGGEAARLACRLCADTAARLDPAALLLPATWITILRAVDRAVAEDPAAGHTTLTALTVTETSICGASCGDSAVALFQGNGFMVVMTARQKKNPPVGSGFAMFVPFAAALVRPWTVLAMSDGVWKYVGWDKITKLAAESSGERLVASLVDHARLRAGGLQDDFSLVGFASADGAPSTVSVCH
jgi:hypothetical protein